MNSTISGTKMYGSNGLSGLVSGMNTEEIVGKLLSGTQNKIDTQYGKKKQLEWKQEIYRDTITDLRTLQTKFFSFSNPQSNLLSSSFFNTLSSSTGSSSAINVEPSADATAGNVKIDRILQLASATKKTSRFKASGKISGIYDSAEFGKEANLIINMDGVERKISIDLTNKDNAVQFVSDLNDNIQKTLGTGITVSQNGDNITFEATGGRQITMVGGTALDALGIDKNTSNKIDLNAKIADVNFAHDLDGTGFAFNINGVSFTVSDNESLRSVMDRVNSSDANVTMSYSSSQDKFVIESKTMGEGVDIEMSQSAGNLLTAMFGTKSSGGIVGKQLKSDIVSGTDFPTDLVSGNFSLKINGTTVNINLPEKADKKPYTIEQAKDELNKNVSSDVLSFYNKDGKLAISSKEGYNVSIPDPIEDTNIADKLGFTAGQNQEVKGDTKLSDLGLRGTLKINGSDVDLSTTGKTIDDLKADLTHEIGNNGTVSFDEAGGGFIIAGVKVPITLEGVDEADKASMVKLFGVESITVNPPEVGSTTVESDIFKKADGNIADGSTKLSELELTGTISIGGTSITIGEKNIDTLVTEIQGEIGGGTISFKDGRFEIKNLKTPITFEGDIQKLFGGEKLDIDSDGSVLVVAQEGESAKLSINGTVVEKNTNNFTVDGLNIELKEESDTAINIDTTRNTDQVYKGIEDFVDEYNKLIKKLNDLINEDTDYKKYDPLTDEQKKEMSESQIKLWEEKSKKGLVRNDSTIRGMLQEMRSMFYTKPEDAKYALYELGIETSKNYKDYGKLVIKDSTKIKNALKTNPKEVQKLFLSEPDGLSVKFNNIIDKAAKASSASPGSLVEIAGIKGGAKDKDNQLYGNIKDVNKNISSLKRKYKMEKNRYWKQFNQMEKVIQQMNQQSSWLMQQFA